MWDWISRRINRNRLILLVVEGCCWKIGSGKINSIKRLLMEMGGE